LPFHALEVLLGIPTKNFANWAVDLDIWVQSPFLEKTLELMQFDNSDFLYRRATPAAKS
jgi:hypothetical protein